MLRLLPGQAYRISVREPKDATGVKMIGMLLTALLQAAAGETQIGAATPPTPLAAEQPASLEPASTAKPASAQEQLHCYNGR